VIEIKDFKVEFLEASIIASGLPRSKEGNFPRAKKLAGCKPGSGHDSFLKGVIVQGYLTYNGYFAQQLQRYRRFDIVSSESKMYLLGEIETVRGRLPDHVPEEAIEKADEALKVYQYHLKVKSPPELLQRSLERLLDQLPYGFLLTLRFTTNYLQLKTIYRQRRKHKLRDWQIFCDWVEELPMFKELVLEGKR